MVEGVKGEYTVWWDESSNDDETGDEFEDPSSADAPG
jgi:hypothetical protein